MKNGKRELIFPHNGSSPRVEFPYTYLMAWLAMHCPTLIKPGEEPPEDARIALLCRFEESKWVLHYVARIRKIVHFHDNYSLFWCFPHIPSTTYGEEFIDNGDGQSSLGHGTFKWLVSIRPSHLLYHCKDIVFLKPYVPSRFARQFGYDHIYVGNLNPWLGNTGSLIDGARTWGYFIAKCTKALFVCHSGPQIF